MKNLFYVFLIFIGAAHQSEAQTDTRLPSLAIIQIDAKGFTIDPAQMGDIARVEADKLGLYRVFDKYDVDYIVKKNNLTVDNCFGTLCSVEIGKALNVDKMLTGSVEYFGEIIVVSLRFVDVGSEEVEKSKVLEFINNRSQVQAMIRLTLMKMFDKKVDEDQFNKLTKPFDYQNTINTPEATKLNLNGPRMGVVIYAGDLSERYRAEKADGGFDAVPVMFQFGYQFEVNYINEGNFQALFEFIPTITGLDQGLFIPSITLLNGLRSSRSGLEFHFGPVLSIAPKADGYYDGSGTWHLKSEWREEHGQEPNPYTIEKRLDSRGDFQAATGFLFGAGKTFKSGRMNIPVNLFFIPGKDQSHRFGLSLGFNANKFK